jgi:hypothetical protein
MNNPMNPTFAPNMGTTSLDLPPALASLLSVGSQAPTMQQPNPMVGVSSGMTGPQTFIPSYQQGGMIGMGGMPVPSGQTSMPNMPPAQGVGVNPAMPSQGQVDPQMLDMYVNQFLNQNPQQVDQIRQAIMEMLQTGQLSQEDLNMAEQLATAVLQNPSMYPYVRNFLIQRGVATEETLSPDFDAGLLFIILLAVRAVKKGGQSQMSIPSMKYGGEVPDSKKTDGAVLINAHEGEYVIPKAVVEMKGKEFFDNLVEKYKGA